MGQMIVAGTFQEFERSEDRIFGDELARPSTLDSILVRTTLPQIS